MQTDLSSIARLAGQSLINPRGVAEALNAMRLNRGILWSLLLLVVILSVIVMSLTMMMFPQSVDNPLIGLPPFGLGIVLGSILVVMVFSFYFTGQMLGGTGRFPGTLLMLTWWQGMAMVIQLFQVAALLVSPIVAAFVSIAGFGWIIAALIIAINVLHGFDNLFKALAVVAIAFIGPVVGLSFILTVIGVTLQGIPA